jgi:hypothetical protein
MEDHEDMGPLRQPFFDIVNSWLAGARLHEIAPRSTLPLDDFLVVHGRVVSFVLQTLVEQGVALLAKLLESQGRTLAPVVGQFPDHLRFGVPTTVSRVLAAGGVRHRSAAMEVGGALVGAGVTGEDRMAIFSGAKRSVLAYRDAWTQRLGALVIENTLRDLSSVLGEATEQE